MEKKVDLATDILKRRQVVAKLMKQLQAELVAIRDLEREWTTQPKSAANAR